MAPFTSDPGHELEPERVKEMLDRGEIELIDVREQYEWDAGRIAGAKHIELERVAGRADELPRDRGRSAGMRVLMAKGSELEREFPFGVVRQLFEPSLVDADTRASWLAGS